MMMSMIARRLSRIQQRQGTSISDLHSSLLRDVLLTKLACMPDSELDHPTGDDAQGHQCSQGRQGPGCPCGLWVSSMALGTITAKEEGMDSRRETLQTLSPLQERADHQRQCPQGQEVVPFYHWTWGKYTTDNLMAKYSSFVTLISHVLALCDARCFWSFHKGHVCEIHYCRLTRISQLSVMMNIQIFPVPERSCRLWYILEGPFLHSIQKSQIHLHTIFPHQRKGRWRHTPGFHWHSTGSNSVSQWVSDRTILKWPKDALPLTWNLIQRLDSFIPSLQILTSILQMECLFGLWARTWWIFYKDSEGNQTCTR